MILRKWLRYFYYVTVRASRNAAGENKKKVQSTVFRSFPCKNYCFISYSLSGPRSKILSYYSYLLKANWLYNASIGLTFKHCTFSPHCIYVFCFYPRTKQRLVPHTTYLIGFYKRDEKCLLRGTDWVFK